jgi:glutamate/tyrosine decarboxylase-like PLP-dependent enzyme
MAQAYLAALPNRNVAANASAIDGLKAFDIELPHLPSEPADTLRLLNQCGSPATTATAGGRFFGLVVGGALPAALGARVLASAWDQIVFNDTISPIGVKLEQVASRWLLDLLGLPPECSVGFVTGATMANFTCLAAARHALLAKRGWDVNTQGLIGAPVIRIVAGRQVHVTVLKVLSMLGLGTSAIEWVECDDQGRIIAADVPALDETTLVLTQAGNVNSGASDAIGEIAARANGAWVHVDGAFGLWAAVSPTTQAQLRGYEAADSWVTDGHKWLNTPYDCGIAICKHPYATYSAMATQAPYLKASMDRPAPKDMVPEFSRSTRGVEVWAALHSLGRVGLREMFERSCSHARSLAAGLRILGFEILNDVTLNQVVATIPGLEHRSADLAMRVQGSGEAWFGSTHWRGRDAVRFSLSSWVTTEDDVRRTLAAVSVAKQSMVA